MTGTLWRLADNDPTIVVTEALDAEGNCTVVADVLTRNGAAGPDDYTNARLIAAAPELLEALRAVMLLRDEGFTKATARKLGLYDEACMSHGWFEAVYNAARAAITKASGAA